MYKYSTNMSLHFSVISSKILKTASKIWSICYLEQKLFTMRFL